MERTLIKDIVDIKEKLVQIAGRVVNLRKLGNITFAIMQDRSGTIQTVWEKKISAKIGDIVSITGEIRKDTRAKGGCEIAGDKIEIIATNAEDYPIDLSKAELTLQLTTLLDHRTITLRHPKIQAIFALYDILLASYERVMREEDFKEIKTPKILEAASEGGANFFTIEYFQKKAFLAQSPQLYKQIMVGVFERVFEIGPVFRAEPHFTTRHVNEYVSLDAEMGHIESFRDVTAMLTKVLKKMFAQIEKEGAKYLELYNVKMPKVPDEIPHIKLSEIKEVIKEKYGYEIPETTDIDPEGEKLAGKYALEQFGSDFIFITHYPWKDKPFYTMPSPGNSEETEGYDLLLKGIEIVTGSQRIHEYKMLIENMEKKGVKPAGMEFYLDTFKFAMPPHGGWGMGSERLIQQIFGLKSVKEAVLFPRDVKRLSP
ncbi:aspartate--tRNA(Asn) ligase [Candidatus Berkelbacteria bacterium CG10_big_fil_rev_8_21_14_0_10_41_12]|uniref:Aspartate--tRNA ligase n=1 Tax=Candidatus Berkelbacteria bacterium CG10_big_fil_rev_8_21_14_0_10_41_12 TaxID=1974513 RepID=A0A2M6WWL6_9BACT|nr:MAG: aspartate--tRNA(Asn) ligase [Candidatus Berkelbacteria bacterium CG10_big_fil_rev_8_21_14_0_10_41_12]